MDDVIDDDLKVVGIFLRLVVDLIIALPPTLPPTNALVVEEVPRTTMNRRFVVVLLIFNLITTKLFQGILGSLLL